ncbi:unnamed protein product, partial [Oikopleura dioica]
GIFVCTTEPLFRTFASA